MYAVNVVLKDLFYSILIIIRCLLYLFFFFRDTLTSIITTSCLGSCHVTFHSSLTVQSARHLNILTNQTTALGMY